MSQAGAFAPSPTLPPEAVLLTANLGNLSVKDQEFACSLLEAARSPRGATPKQIHWLAVLAERATATPVEAVKVTGDLSKLNEMFRKARENLKNPSILVQGPAHRKNCETLRLKQAGERSRYYGQVYVYSSGAYEDRTWFGRIDETGSFHPSHDLTSLPDQGREAIADIVASMVVMAENPEAAARAYGQRFGVCCFCSRELTNKASIFAGYGPICADKYGLAWGTCEEVA